MLLCACVSCQVVSEWDAEFVNVEQEVLFELILVGKQAGQAGHPLPPALHMRTDRQTHSCVWCGVV